MLNNINWPSFSSTFGHYILAHILIAVFPLAVGLLVFIHNPREQLNRVFLFYNACMSWWGFFNLFMALSPNAKTALFWDRVSLMGIVLIPITFLHFTLHFLGKNRRLRALLQICYALSGIFAIATWTTAMAKNVSRKHFVPYFTDPGWMYHFFLLFFGAVMIMALIFSWEAFLEAQSRSKKKTNYYFFMGALIATVGGSGNFFVPYDIFIPFLIPYGSFGVVLYAFITGYLIVHHRFLDIEVIIKKTLIFAGLFGMAMVVISVVSTFMRVYLGRYITISNDVLTLVSVFIAILFYTPTRNLLVSLTDKYLFQKKAIYYKLLRENSKQIAMIHSLDEIAKQIVGFLIKQGRIRNAGIFVYLDDTKEFQLRYPLGYGGRQNRPDMNLGESHPLIQYLIEKKNALTKADAESNVGIQSAQILSVIKTLKAEVLIPSFLSVQVDGEGNFKEQKLRSILVLGPKKSDQDYTEEDLSVFYTIAQESAIAAEKARLFDVVLREREEKMRAQSEARMVGCAKSVSHEIKNALAGIYGPAELLSDYVPEDISRFAQRYLQLKDDPDAQRSLEKIIQKMKEKGTILREKAEEIRVVAKTAQGTLSSDEKEFDTHSFKVLWDTAVSILKAKFPQVKFIRELPLPDSFCNPILLCRVLVNLFMNAAEAMEKTVNPEVITRGSLKAYNDRQGTYFEVSDNGPGIPPSILEKVFEQGFSTKPKPRAGDTEASGYGQGLWVCKQTIEETHGGKLWIESQLGKGTTFKFWLPQKPQMKGIDV